MKEKLIVAMAGDRDYNYYPNIERTLDKLRTRVGSDVEIILAHNDLTGIGFMSRMYSHSRKLPVIIVPTDSDEHNELLMSLCTPNVLFTFITRPNPHAAHLAALCVAKGIPVHAIKPHPNDLVANDRAKQAAEVTA
jgi:hypothetical protein